MKRTERLAHIRLTNLIMAVALLFFVASCTFTGPAELGAIRIGDTFTARGFGAGNVDNQQPITSSDGKITLKYGVMCSVNQKSNKLTVHDISGDQVWLDYSTDDTEVLKTIDKSGLPPCFTGVIFEVSQEKYLEMKNLSAEIEAKIEKENAKKAPRNP